MTDNLDRIKRSKIMSSIRGKNTRPELLIRKIIWSSGKRYRIHDKTVYGRPDISNKKRKIAVFIDGCFWHGCKQCYKEPTTNVSYWREKIIKNQKRRMIVKSHLQMDGWLVLEFWEHEIIKQPPLHIASKICDLMSR